MCIKLKPICCSCISPWSVHIIEYCVQAWRPHLVKDIALIEKVQHRSPRMNPSLRNLSSQRRLEELNLTTMEITRLIGDLIEVFTIVNGFYDIQATDSFISTSKYKRSLF